MQKNQAVLYYHLIYKQILEKVFCVAFLEIPKKKFLWTGLVTTVTRVTKVTRVIRLRCLSSYLEWVSHQDLRKIACVGCFRYFVFVFVVVFVFFVFVFPHDFWIAFIISFQNMYGYRGLWSLLADIDHLWSDDGQTHIDSPNPPIDSAHPVRWAKWKPHDDLNFYWHLAMLPITLPLHSDIAFTTHCALMWHLKCPLQR